MRKTNLLALLVLIPFIVYEGPAMAQGGVSQSISTTTLQTYSSVKTVTAMTNHLVQPFGKYTSTPSGTIYAANGVDNVTISLQSGFPSFSSYQANSTLQSWASGCQKEQNIEKGPNLVISYIGIACASTPILKVDFSPLPSYNQTANSCTVFWLHESYSWCGDSSFSYSAGVLTIVPTSTTFDEDPIVVQSNNNGCGSLVDNKCNASFGSNVSAGDIVGVAAEMETDTNGVTLSANDSQGYTYSTAVSTAPNCFSIQFCLAYVFYTTASATSSLTISVKCSSSVNFLELSLQIFDVSGIATSGIATGTGSGSGTAVATSSTSWTEPSVFALAAVTTASAPTFTPGSSFTALPASGAARAFAQYSTTVSSPTTFPGTVSSGGWSEAGASFPGLANSLFVLSVSQSSSGMILMPTINNAATTVLSSTTLTATCCTTNTWTIIGVPWGGNIFERWSGATTWIQNTLNPTQTITYSSYTTSTLSSTLTAQFSNSIATASTASTAGYATTASTASTAGYATTASSASTAGFATSASSASTASYVINPPIINPTACGAGNAVTAISTTSAGAGQTITYTYSCSSVGSTTNQTTTQIISNPDYTWLILLPFAVLALVLILRRR